MATTRSPECYLSNYRYLHIIIRLTDETRARHHALARAALALEGNHEAIVDREEWLQVADLRQAKARTFGRGRPVVGHHLFRKGFLRCGQCGGAMIPRTNPNRAAPPSETYECFTRKLDTDACSQMPLQRADVDGAVLAYFEQVGLDLDATREQFAAAMDRKLEETRLLLETAEREAAVCGERLARVKRDYLAGDLTPAEWRGLRTELEPEASAAQAEVERLAHQLDAHQSGDAVFAAESEVIELVERIRQAVAGKIRDAKAAEAVSATLLRLFDQFTYHAGPPARANVELIDTECWIEPSIRSEAIQAHDNQMRPIIAKEPLVQASNSCLEGLVT